MGVGSGGCSRPDISRQHRQDRAKGLGGPKARLASASHAYASLTTSFRRHGSFSLCDLTTTQAGQAGKCCQQQAEHGVAAQSDIDNKDMLVGTLKLFGTPLKLQHCCPACCMLVAGHIVTNHHVIKVCCCCLYCHRHGVSMNMSCTWAVHGCTAGNTCTCTSHICPSQLVCWGHQQTIFRLLKPCRVAMTQDTDMHLVLHCDRVPRR